MKNVMIIGGGPASSMFAYRVKQVHPNYRVTIFEQDNKLLKRILVSGNGRSNFFNKALLDNKVYEAYNYMSFLEYFNLTSCAADVLETFSQMGFSYYFDMEGRGYPFANTAESLRQTLISNLDKIGVEILLNTKVTSIDAQAKTITTLDNTFPYDILFIGVGGSAYDRTPDSFKSIIGALGISYIDQTPALCPLITANKFPKFLVGTRLKGNMILYKDNTPFYDEPGEILFKKDGISGICIFDASLFINDASNYKIAFNPFIHDGYMTSLDEKESLDYLHGLFPSNLIKYFEMCGYQKMDELDVLKCLTFNIIDKYPLKNAQISLGGINPNEISSDLSLVKYPNILVGGEIVDLHGICGGYNLGSAFLMGYKAAEAVD